MLIRMSVIALLITLAGCANLEALMGGKEQKFEPLDTPILKPEIDYAAEYPDCMTAGKRLAENIEIGMTLNEVTRLVGKPRWKVPGSWWWSKSFSKEGKPLVRFAFQKGREDTRVTAIETDTSRCEADE